MKYYRKIYRRGWGDYVWEVAHSQSLSPIVFAKGCASTRVAAVAEAEERIDAQRIVDRARWVEVSA